MTEFYTKHIIFPKSFLFKELGKVIKSSFIIWLFSVTAAVSKLLSSAWVSITV